MAPRKPVNRPRHRTSHVKPSIRSSQTIDDKSSKSPNGFPTRHPTDTLAPSKRDKRQVKRSLLLSKVRSSADPSQKRAAGIQKHHRSRTKPSKLNTSLSALEQALPSILSATKSSAENRSSSAMTRKRAHTDVRSKPGFQVKREALRAAEKSRMAKNMASMTLSKADSMGVDLSEEQLAKARSQKFAALRAHLQSSTQSQSIG